MTTLLHTVVLFGLAWTANTLAALPVYYDSSNIHHRDLQYHPEQPERVTACVQALQDVERVQLLDVAERSSSSSASIQKTHLPFDDKELQQAKDVLLQTHQPDLVLKLEERTKQSREQRRQEGKPEIGHMGYIDSDTYLTTETFDIALRAAATWIKASQENPLSLVLTRPPGHHATFSSQNGFCIFNFAAATAIHAISRQKKVSILDWDVHYGQGVADCVQRQNPDAVRYVSLHQLHAFPYLGDTREQVGNVLTLPYPPDTTWTCGYQELFQTALKFVYNNDWTPDLIIVCAGFDALASDELASTSLNASNYGDMTRQLLQHVQATKPSIVFGLEGGYQLNEAGPSGNLPDAVLSTVQALLEQEIE